MSTYPVMQYRDADAPPWRIACRRTLDHWYGARVRIVTPADLVSASAGAGGPDAARISEMLPLQREDLARALMFDGGVWVSDSVVVLRPLDTLHSLAAEFDAALFSPYFVHAHWIPEVCVSRSGSRLMAAVRAAALREAHSVTAAAPRALGRRLFSTICPTLADGADILKMHSYHFWPVPADASASALAAAAADIPRTDMWCAALGELGLALDNLNEAALEISYPGLAQLYRRALS